MVENPAVASERGVPEDCDFAPSSEDVAAVVPSSTEALCHISPAPSRNHP